ncbi:hypothetical protein ACWGDT_33665 [Streptomyces avermitilis]
MDALLPYLAFVGCLVVALGFFTWLALLVRRRGAAGAGVRSAMASYEEAWHVSGHESYYEIRAQDERKAPVESPDGMWRPSHGYRARPGPRPRRRLRRRRAHTAR